MLCRFVPDPVIASVNTVRTYAEGGKMRQLAEYCNCGAADMILGLDNMASYPEISRTGLQGCRPVAVTPYRRSGCRLH